MLKRILILTLALGFLMSCTQSTKDEKAVLLDSIKKLELQCFDDETISYNHKVALKTLHEYQLFIEAYPNDSLTPNYLYLSGQLSKSINLFGEAVRKFETLIKDYPEFKDIAKAQFLIGMIYENNLQDTLKAKAAYQEFIDNYPQNELVDDAQFLIQNLSLSDQELIEFLKSKNK